MADQSNQARPGKARSPQAKKAAVKEQGATSADRRAALRAQQQKEAARKRRNKQILIAALVIGLALLLTFVGLGMKSWLDKPKTSDAPQNVTKDNAGIVINPGKAKAGAKTVQLIEDFQCPYCKQLDSLYLDTLLDMSKNGDINFEIHQVTFMDSNMPQSRNSSLRSAQAAACVALKDSDHYVDYFRTVFAAQPEKEGVGYTDDQLQQDFMAGAKIPDDKRDQIVQCIKNDTTKNWVQQADTKNQALMSKAGATGTPALLVDGKPAQLTSQLLTTKNDDAFKAALDAAK